MCTHWRSFWVCQAVLERSLELAPGTRLSFENWDSLQAGAVTCQRGPWQHLWVCVRLSNSLLLPVTSLLCPGCCSRWVFHLWNHTDWLLVSRLCSNGVKLQSFFAELMRIFIIPPPKKVLILKSRRDNEHERIGRKRGWGINSTDLLSAELPSSFAWKRSGEGRGDAPASARRSGG